MSFSDGLKAFEAPGKLPTGQVPKEDSVQSSVQVATSRSSTLAGNASTTSGELRQN